MCTFFLILVLLGAWEEGTTSGAARAAAFTASIPVQAGSAKESDEAALYDRLHQTFVLLNDQVIPAYLDHFRDDPGALHAVEFYAGRLAEVRGEPARAAEFFARAVSGEAASLDPRLGTLRRLSTPRPADRSTISANPTPAEWMELANLAARDSDVEGLKKALSEVGSAPHIELQRGEADGNGPLTARCPLYDPGLFDLHRRLRELQGNRVVKADMGPVADQLAVAQATVRELRGRPENSDLSLRKFLEQNRAAVWTLGLSHHRLGQQYDREGDSASAQASYRRAWAVGDALFPVSDRGRLDRFDKVFLAELGDVYASLKRYDLMLRYIYSEQGLPAQLEMARPVAVLARLAESVRLARTGETPAEELSGDMPETVSEILFEQPVLPRSKRESVPIADVPETEPIARHRLGWAFVGGGALFLVGTIVWLFIRLPGR